MKNSLYHEFTIGFNFWYIAVVIFIGLMIWFGTVIFAIKKGRIIRCYRDTLLKVAAIVFAFITAAMVMIESSHGIIQTFDNCLGYNESGFYSIICTIITIVGIGFFTEFLYYSIGKIASWAKCGYLIETRRRHLGEEVNSKSSE